MGRWRAGTHFSSSHCLSLLVFLCLVLACLVSKICLGDSSDMEAEGFEVDCSFGRLGILARVCVIGSDSYKILKISEMQACITI